MISARCYAAILSMFIIAATESFEVLAFFGMLVMIKLSGSIFQFVTCYDQRVS